ncbi:MAG: serine hydrolase domain-containing protein [Myxococcota bacterium]
MTILLLLAVGHTDLDRAVPRWLQESGVPAVSVAVIEDGRLSFSATYGEARPGVPADSHTVFNVASLTKPLVAEAVLRLASAGRLDLDAPLSEHWVDPDLVDDPRHHRLTARFALSHRTGFPNWRDGVLSFQGDPGVTPSYSGEGYEYIARYLEKKLGDSLESLVKTHVLKPLNMSRTALSKKPWLAKSVAHAQDAQGQSRPADVRNVASAADDALTHATDYAKFLLAVMHNRGVTAATAQERLKIDLLQMPEGRCPWQDCPQRIGFGLGWAVFDYGDERVVMQGGGDWGERALAFFVPERRFGMVILANSHAGGDVIEKIVAALYDNPRFHRFLAFQNNG